ncbi:MAG: hypothetical protein A3G83_08685 [Betaproteobacteria bacterium RIFCSPLOWO2_12_FULL_68_20]|nr:MAG: hypothetical protein A3G83_08685 [Betaproteobacteria bacterium RIFCSPLOWO2_12_FULL_68_20]
MSLGRRDVARAPQRIGEVAQHDWMIRALGKGLPEHLLRLHGSALPDQSGAKVIQQLEAIRPSMQTLPECSFGFLELLELEVPQTEVEHPLVVAHSGLNIAIANAGILGSTSGPLQESAALRD